MCVLTWLRKRNDALGACVVVIFLFLHHATRLEGAGSPDGLVALHAGHALVLFVYLQQVVQWRDLGQLSARRVGGMLHAQLVQDLLLDGLQTQVPEALPEHARLAARKRRRFVFSLIDAQLFLVDVPVRRTDVPRPGDAGSVCEMERCDACVTAPERHDGADTKTQDKHCKYAQPRTITTVCDKCLSHFRMKSLP